MQFIVKNIADWQEVIKKITPELKHNILCLKGNLGAGKTTFSQFLVNSFGSKDEVTSPTYTIVNEYHSPSGKIFHFDLYRMKTPSEVYDIGIEEYLEDAFFTIIEWPEIFEEELWKEHHVISIEKKGEGRIVVFK